MSYRALACRLRVRTTKTHYPRPTTSHVSLNGMRKYPVGRVFVAPILSCCGSVVLPDDLLLKVASDIEQLAQCLATVRDSHKSRPPRRSLYGPDAASTVGPMQSTTWITRATPPQRLIEDTRGWPGGVLAIFKHLLQPTPHSFFFI